MDAKRPVVYICSKFRGDIGANTEMARRYCRYAIRQGAVPIAPHLMLPQFMDEESERELALEADLLILSRCDEIWICGEEMSAGMAAEAAFAKERNMKERRMNEEDLGCTRSGKE